MDDHQIKNRLTERFLYLYGNNPCDIYFAPGRVNLIGEHTDYNGGHVFPCALSLGTYAAIRPRDDMTLNLSSENIHPSEVFSYTIDSFEKKDQTSWTAYPRGVFWAMKEAGLDIPCGFDVLYLGNIPAGSGLSSSASIEVLTALFIKDVMGLDGLSFTDIALLCQKCENGFVGMNCGIMDQFSSARGKAGQAIFLDTNTLKFDYVPIDLPQEDIVITNTNVKHSLVDSAYNDRRSQCEKALELLKSAVDITALGDLSEEGFEAHKHVLKDEVILKRARHAVYENLRTIRAKAALEKNDLATFGRLMNESHISLRDDYEVSCPELDILAEAAWGTDGIYGSRMTGGGFGGCTVSIIKKEQTEAFKEKVGKIYTQKTGITPDFYTVSPGNGPGKL